MRTCGPHARRVLAWLTGGESLNNNHLSVEPQVQHGPFEFDPSWVVIRVLMQRLLARLVGNQVQVAPIGE